MLLLHQLVRLVTERLIVAWMVKNVMHFVGPEHSLQNFSRKNWT